MSVQRSIVGAHSSGKWTMTDSLPFARNVKKMREFASFVTRTECSDKDFGDVLEQIGRELDDNWRFFWPAGLYRDCCIEFDGNVWKLIDHGVLPLTSIRIETKGGFLLPPASLVWVVLENKITGDEVEIGATHLDLANTSKRIAANITECRTLRKHYRSQRKQHPKRDFILQMDGNRNQKLRKWRFYFATQIMVGTGLHSGWKMPLPEGGTHGKSLLDVALSTLACISRLVVDDKSSDHRPFVTRYMLRKKTK